MSDVIDEELMRELGLDDDDIKDLEGQKKPPVAKSSATDEQASIKKAEAAPGLPKKNTTDTAPKASVPAAKPTDLTSLNEAMTQDVPVQLAAVLAKKPMTLGQVLSIRVGEVLELGHKPTDTVDLVAGGKLVAKAELVMIDGQVGVRVVKLIR